jgi:hypothetical protein
MPVSPDEIGKKKREIIPQFIFDAFDELIALDYENGRAIVYADDVRSLINTKMPEGVEFNFDWLNVEDAYEDAGWKVRTDFPGFNESYRGHFIFTKRKKK